MRTRRLGRTRLAVTLMALGGAPIGRPSADRTAAMRTVWAALEGGVNTIDTSPHYGLGRSEIIIGEALRERPDLAAHCHISTKTGHYQQKFANDYDTTRRSVALSIERLRRDYLDIVHIHDVREPAAFAPAMDGAHRALLQYKEEGVIGAIGLGTKSIEIHRLALASDGFDVLMIANQYDLLNTSAAGIIAEAARRDVGVMLAGVYATGILAKGSADPQSRYRYQPAPDAIRARVAAMEEICHAWGCSLPAAAIQFCLRGVCDKAVIALGARTACQATSSIAELEAQIPEGFWHELDPLLAQLESRASGDIPAHAPRSDHRRE